MFELAKYINHYNIHICTFHDNVDVDKIWIEEIEFIKKIFFIYFIFDKDN